ncbi:MAG: PDZ domain-containing protein [Pirellulaceae bacterium]|nr:PDZ domain-containing protein [Pirellulaceae bacterium]
MVIHGWLRNISSVALTTAALAGSTALAEQPARIKVVAGDTGDGQPKVLFIREETVADEAEAGAGEYWIGLELGELTELVKEQLGLKQGLVIENVVPDSPAAKAGLKPHDILTKAGDMPLAAHVDLMKVVNESKDQELIFTVIRGGKEMTFKATPTKRPVAPAQRSARERERLVERAIQADEGRELFEQLQKTLDEFRSKIGNEPVRGWFAHPGVVVGDVLKKVEFPKNLTVRITKEGNQPAKVYVKRDDQEWEVAADKLSDLPEDIRVHVQPMVGGGNPFRITWTAPAIAAVPGVPAVPPIPTPPMARVQIQPFRAEPQFKQLAEKLDELTSELKELRKEVDELRKK